MGREAPDFKEIKQGIEQYSSLEQQENDFLSNLDKGDFFSAYRLLDQYKFDSKFLSSPEAQLALETGLLQRQLPKGPQPMTEDWAIQIIEDYGRDDSYDDDYDYDVQYITDALRPASGYSPKLYKLIERAVQGSSVPYVNLFDVDSKIIKSSKVQDALAGNIIAALSNWQYDDAIKLEPLVSDGENYQKIQVAAVEVMIKFLYHGDFDNAVKLKQAFNLSGLEAQDAAKEGIIACLADDQIGQAIKIKDEFFLPAEIISSPEIQDAAKKQGIVNHLLQGDLGGAINIKDQFSIPAEIITSPEVQDAAKQAIIKNLSAVKEGSYRDNNVAKIIEAKDQFLIPAEVIASEEVHNAAKQAVTNILFNDCDDYTDGVIKIKDHFFLTEPEVQAAAMQAMVNSLSSRNVYAAVKIRDKFSLSGPETQAAATQEMIECFDHLQFKDSEGAVDSAIEIKNKFSLPAEVIASDGVQSAVRRGVIACLTRGMTIRAIKIKDEFFLPAEVITAPEVQAAAKEGMVKRLSEGRIDEAVDVKKQFNLPAEVILSPEVQKLAKEKLIIFLNILAKGKTDADTVIKIKDEFLLSPEVIASPEVHAAVKTGVVDKLEKSDLTDAIRIKDSFSLLPEIVTSVEVHAAAKSEMEDRLVEGKFNDADKIKTQFFIPESEVQAVAREAMVHCLSKSRVTRSIEIKDRFSISDEFIASAKVQDLVKQRLAGCLVEDKIDLVFNAKKAFSPSVEIIASPEVQAAAKQGLIHSLGKGVNNVKNAIKIKNEFSLPDEFITSPEVQVLAKQKLISCLSAHYTYLDDAIRVRDQFSLPEFEVRAAAKQQIINCFTASKFDDAIRIKESFSLSESEVKTAAEQSMVGCLSQGSIDNALKIKFNFSISDEFINSPECQAAAMKGIVSELGDNLDNAIKIKDQFPLPGPEVQAAAKRGMIDCLSKGKIDYAIKTKDAFALPIEVITSPEVQAAAIEGMINQLSIGSIDSAIKAKDQFILPEPEVHAAAKRGMTLCLASGLIDSAIKIKNQFTLSDEVIKEPEIQETLKKTFTKLLENESASSALDLYKNFKMADNSWARSLANQAFVKFLTNNKSAAAKMFDDYFSFDPAEKLMAVDKVLGDCLVNGKIDQAVSIKNQFPIYTKEIIAVAAQAGLSAQLIQGNVAHAKTIVKEFFAVDDPQIVSIVKATLVSYIIKGDLIKFEEIKKAFDINSDIMQDSEAQTNVQNLLVRLFSLLQLDSIDKLYLFARENKFKLDFSESKISEGLSQKINDFRFVGEASLFKNATIAMYLAEEYAIKLPPTTNPEVIILVRAYGDFGNNLTPNILSYYQKLEDSQEVPAELAEFGVKRTGKAGLNELRVILRKVQNDCINGKIDPQLLVKEQSVLASWFKAIVSFDSFSFGSKGSFSGIMRKYLESKDTNRLLPKEFTPSKIVLVTKIDKEKQANFEYSPTFKDRYGVLLNSILSANTLIEKKGDEGLVDILQNISKTKKTVLSNTEKKLENCGQDQKRLSEMKEEELTAEDKKIIKKMPFAVKGLENKIAALQAVNIDNLSSYQEIFNTLKDFNEFYEDLRQLIFYLSLQINPVFKEKFKDKNPDRPTMDDLSMVIDFIDHITNQETLAQYFTDEKAAKNFDSLIHTASLAQELSRWQNQETAGTMPIRFIPTRDVLLYFSAHIADACWGDKFNIGKDFPNFEAMIMVQNPDDPKNEKLCGASLLIEANSKQGEPLLIIRGLNPQESTINQLHQEDFVGAVREYLAPIAKKMGRQLAIAIDDHRGGSGTNRQVLHDYLYKTLMPKLEQIKLDPEGLTQFNNYSIISKTYLLK